MVNPMQYLPMLEGEEMIFVQTIMQDMDENQAMQFAQSYSARRKDSQTILIMALIGIVGIHGIHRFMLNQIGMGILYLLTYGLCGIGTIVDLVNHKKLTAEYNQKVAQEVAMYMRGSR